MKPSLTIVRCFSGKDKDDEDPWGVNYDDGTDHGKLGPSASLPPKYKRDSATGKFTGEIEAELTNEERGLLDMDDIEKERHALDLLVEQWKASETDEMGGSAKRSEFARRIMEEEMALNTLGRSPEAQSAEGVTEDGKEAYQDETGFSQPLSRSEFLAFKGFMKKEHDAEISEADIPIQDAEEEIAKSSASDNPDLDLSWMSASAQRAMDDSEENDPFLDLMPSDFNPARKVNRRKAKPIPRELIHHNNLSLLRRYITPGGSIMNRVQSRLGAKDQRKIAKLIKRARHLGLIPHVGQWKFENHGNLYEKDIHEDKEWEQELVRRGLAKIAASKQEKKEE